MRQHQHRQEASSDAALIEAFRTTSTAVISDNLDRLPGALGLRPFYSGGVMAGRAVTVRTSCGDNLAVYRALDLLEPGNVLVIDGGGDTGRALIGEIMAAIAASKGAAGIVVDGAIRDSAVLSRSSFPCFARAAIHRGPYKNGPGAINESIAIGGMVVEPGNVVVGDEDGVVAFPVAKAPELLAAVREQQSREAEILLSIREGRYRGAYGKESA
ncbi:RraA family protein [Mycobacterium sp. KBS0706]|uniref:RraA family protein n=1 Tax=Mycobacterium sp. KBS0706 TaxID=2578109 RepID=UPI00110F99D3|nr:RraA family protein [Mycobacterium sp. KBS0706]TSD83496.1 RraA family protein [Mycobacterium sp. KBS0706]